MADKAISALTEATVINDADRFVLEQSGQAKQISGATMIAEFAEALDGHGGIQSIDLVSTVGKVKTYRITFADGTHYDYQVSDGEPGGVNTVNGQQGDIMFPDSRQLISDGYTQDMTPYNFRATPHGFGDRKTEKIVGGTIAWNQICNNYPTTTSAGIKLTNDGNGKLTASGTSSGGGNHYFIGAAENKQFVKNHKYFVTVGTLVAGGIASIMLRNRTSSTNYASVAINSSHKQSVIVNADNDGVMMYYLNFPNANTSISGDICPMVSDLTIDFGPTIADYLYTLETATAGAGIAKFRQLFPKPYYAYDAGTLMSVKTSKAVMTGFNQFDISKKTDNKLLAWATGQPAGETKSAISDYIPAIPGMTYYCNYKAQWCCYDANYTYLGAVSNVGLVFSAGYEINLVTLPSGYPIAFIRLGLRTGTNGSADMTAKTDINLNYHWDGERDGEYEPFKTYEYALDSDLELRGVWKLDSNNDIYCDGDEYESDGTVTRRYGVVDLGTLSYVAGGSTEHRFYTTGLASVIKKGTDGADWIKCAKYIPTPSLATLSASDGYMWLSSSGNVSFSEGSYSTAAAFKTAMSGVYLCYELATPTTETADPYINPMIVDEGTEEFVDSRDVAIPVGNDAHYHINIRKRVEERLPDPPSEDGTYTLKCIVSSGVKIYTWEA